MHSRFTLLLTIGLCLTLAACNGGEESYTPCTSDAECDQGQVCVENECQAAGNCTTDGDCEDGRICEEGYCTAAHCGEDGDCAEDEVCEEHRCVAGPVCDCVTDADCAPSDYCKDKCTCTPREVIPCENDDECDPDQLCLDDECQMPPSCGSDGDCPQGTVCEGSRCERPCTSDTDCGDPNYYSCVDGHCLQRCLGDYMCQGLICENNVCVDPECTSDEDCPGELIRCQNGRCETYTTCATDDDCDDPNYECIEEICEERQQCAIEQDCWNAGLTDHTCQDGHCLPVPTCAFEEDCDPEHDCVGGRCVPHVCRGPADCTGDQICTGGECVDPDPGETVYQVIILNPGGPIVEGQQIQLVAVALTQAGDEVPGVEMSWASSETDSVSVEANGLITSGGVAGDAEITATAVTANIVSDPVTFTNVLSAQVDTLRITVVQAIDRAPVEGASVVMVSGVDTLTGVTDATGIVTFALPAGVADVHVFSDQHNYVSIIGTISADLLVPLPERSDRTEVGGFTGQMTFSGIGALSLGLAGTSMAGNLVDMDFARLMGQTFNVIIPDPINISIPLPAQMVIDVVFMGFELSLKDTYYVAGQTGLRTAWSMGGRLDQSVMESLIGGGWTSVEDVLIVLLPYFSLLDHGVHPVVDVFPYPLVVDSNDIDKDGDFVETRPDWEDMLDLDMEPMTEQNLAVQVSPPPLPTHGVTQLSRAMFVSGALTPLGFTPLGMSAEQNDAGLIPPTLMKMAPAYGGLQVGGYAVLVMGFPPGDGQELSTDMAAVLEVADNLPTDVTFDSGFLGFPEDAAFEGLTRTMAATGVGGADLYRSTFQAPGGGWEVYLPNAQMVTFSLPAPPDGMADLAADAFITLDPIALIAGTGFEDLVTFNGDDLDQLNRLATAFSRYQLP